MSYKKTKNKVILGVILGGVILIMMIIPNKMS